MTHTAAVINWYADGDHLRLVNLGLLALILKSRLTSRSRKETEEIDKAQIVCLLYTSISFNNDSDDLSIRSDRKTGARKKELTAN